jgi:hypothetical protein
MPLRVGKREPYGKPDVTAHWVFRINYEIATRVELELVNFEVKKPGWGKRRDLIERLLQEWLNDGALFPDTKIVKPAKTTRWDIRIDASLAALVTLALVDPANAKYKPEWGEQKQLIEALLFRWLERGGAGHQTYLLTHSDVEEAHRQAIAPLPPTTPYNEEQILEFAETAHRTGRPDGVEFTKAIIKVLKEGGALVDLLNNSPKLRNFMHREIDKAVTIEKHMDDPAVKAAKSGRVAHRRAAQKEEAAFRADLAARVVSLAEERLSLIEEELDRLSLQGDHST